MLKYLPDGLSNNVGGKENDLETLASILSKHWCWLLGYAGMKTGEHWEDLKVYFHEFHYVIIGAGIIFLIWYVRRHFKQD